MHVLFVEPSFPSNQTRHAKALSDGARVTGIGEISPDMLPSAVREALDNYEQVQTVVHEGIMLETVKKIQAREWVDRLEATVEAHIMPTAHVREKCGIPGLSVETSYLCRDKPAMKEFLRNNDVPCAASTRATSADEARAFAKKEGYPLIFKPPAGAGASNTDQINNDEELEEAITRHGIDRGREVAIEEFIEGHEGFYDTLVADGKIIHEFASHYYPRVLTAMRTREVNPYFITTNRVDLPGYEEVKELGRKVIKAMNITTSATHMEWFFGPKGLKFSEIGCRPPGVGVWDLYSAANDFDLYKEWAMAIVHGKGSQPPSRRYSAGLLNLRPEGDGRIAAYEGLDAVEQRFGEHIIDSKFPPVGSGTQPVEAGYMANAYMRLRHPDYDTLREIMETIGQTIKVRVQ